MTEYICELEECSTPIKKGQAYSAEGLKVCQKHYGRWYRHRSFESRERKYSPTCSVEGCTEKHRGKGFCGKHRTRFVRHGNPLLEPDPPAHSPSIDNHGYRRIYKPDHPSSYKNGYIREHRWIMSEMLGRDLLATENIHHKNGDRLDNSPENLELWVTMQPTGQRPEDLVDFAVEILKRYRPALLKED